MLNMTGSLLSIFSHPGKITVYFHGAGKYPYWPGKINVRRLRLGQIWESRDDNQANMKMPMY